ncbi:hypothetical protein GALMADRAFT_1344210 [Galerina marginata CBS 339.88]|uniref:glucan 1,3-beta-glucosidase n=1 Tax=Galerina marginata (strain CBS 339.88) TaxID=685588 RepID=A0A067SPR2_GALM3|nr:hypothetical protein GALMADRAFT_1344210 [Galerina marginata CBS 339.88]
MGESKESQLLALGSLPRTGTGEGGEGVRLADEPSSKSVRRRNLLFLVLFVGFIVVLLAVLLPIFLVVLRHHKSAASQSGSAGSGGGSSAGNPHPTTSPSSGLTGGDGSTVTLANGTTFVYRNSFGGFWIQNPADPFNSGARPNSWTPPLNSTWTWGKDRAFGVNLGGWLVLEPFITPDIFQRYPTATDEYSLSQLMAADTANGGLQQIEDHYDTFITEQDIAEIAGAGLNYLRVPIAFWAVETWDGEPYLAKTSWKYFIRLVGWARKYGLRIFLDLHAVPGAQNNYNHAGRGGTAVNFMHGNMGLANAERTLYYIRVITEFISQPEYKDVVTIFGLVNEALITLIGMDQMTSFYLRAHDMIRNITGLGEGHGPYIAIHDAFLDPSTWSGFLQGSDRVILDEHPYFAFGGLDTDPVDVNGPSGQPGGKWSPLARQNFGVTLGGEFSASPNDCGLFLLGVDKVSTNPQCPMYGDWQNYSDAMKSGLSTMVSASFDALGDWFFWTWKVGSSSAGTIDSPLWSYQLGLRNGWIPKDPRTAKGECATLGANVNVFDGNYLPWQTGTPSSIPAASSVQFPWPPPTISNADVAMSLLPTYTNTGPVATLAVQTFTGAPSQATNGVDGWFDNNDTEGGIVTVAGCPYPNEYTATFSVVPTAACTGPATNV